LSFFLLAENAYFLFLETASSAYESFLSYRAKLRTFNITLDEQGEIRAGEQGLSFTATEIEEIKVDKQINLVATNQKTKFRASRKWTP
jgi:hypothetical protein